MRHTAITALKGALLTSFAVACNGSLAEEAKTTEPAPSASGTQPTADPTADDSKGSPAPDMRPADTSSGKGDESKEGETGTTTEHETGMGNGVGPGEAGSAKGDADGRPG